MTVDELIKALRAKAAACEGGDPERARALRGQATMVRLAKEAADRG